MSRKALISAIGMIFLAGASGEGITAPPAREVKAVTEDSTPSPASAARESIRARIDRGDYAAAEEAARSALDRAQRIGGPESLEAARMIDLLVEVLLERGKQSEPETERLARRAVAIKESISGPGHPEVASSLMLLGEVLRRRGDSQGALELFTRARAIRDEQLPPGHPDIADSLYRMAVVLTAMGDYVESRRLFDAALDLYRVDPGPRSREVGMVLSNLATMLYIRGDFAEAKKTFERALEIRRDALGPTHPHVAGTLNNYGSLLEYTGELERARQVFEQAIAIQEAAHREKHPRLANSIQNLGIVLQKMGDLEGAKRCFIQAVETHETVLGPDHPRVAAGRDSLGTFLLEKGDYGAAQAQFERALAIRRRALGPQHPDVAVILNNLARALAARGAIEKAIETALEAEAISGDHLQLTISALSEREALNYASARSTALDLVLSLSGAELGHAIGRDIWNAVIRSRAIVLDEMANRYRSIGVIADPEVQRLAAELREARSELADLLVAGPQPESTEAYPDLVARARGKRERAERSLADRSLFFRNLLEQSRARWRDIRAGIPDSSALIAYYAHREVRPGAGGDGETVRRYVAFVQRADATRPTIVQLGEAEGIEAAISGWLGLAARAPGRSRSEIDAAEAAAREAGEAVRGAIWDPLKPALGDVERAFIVPAGALHMVSLQALPAGEGRYLIDTSPIVHYLAAERDLIRPETRMTANRGLFILGDPAYEMTAVADRSETGRSGIGQTVSREAPHARIGATTRSGCGSFKGIRFPRLPETAREVEQVSSLWRREVDDGRGEVLSLSGSDATEQAFKTRSGGYRIIHLATHGFFLGGGCPSADPNGRGFAGLEPDEEEAAVENPLLLAGLVFAGANNREEMDPDEEDGILTAEEIAATDLTGVEWAVLSACDTGMGEIRSGEGVFGLRRAFQVAGVGTLIMSLWEVDDAATADWMLELYRGRLRGLSTADSVRGAGLAVLNQRRIDGMSTHPFFWGAFVAAGGWR